MTDNSTGGMAALLETAAGELEPIDRNERDDWVEWGIGGVVFAAVSGDRAEFRLARPVAAAALRTPDTAPSDRGPDWVSFAPAALDRHASDRAVAWFGSAWRRADAER